MEILIGIVIVIIALWLGIKLFGLALWLLWTLLIGLMVGALGRLVLPGRQDMSIIATALFGIAGAFAGRFVGGLMHLGFILTFAAQVALAALFIGIVAARRG